MTGEHTTQYPKWLIEVSPPIRRIILRKTITHEEAHSG
jgi:hypothetical protein